MYMLWPYIGVGLSASLSIYLSITLVVVKDNNKDTLLCVYICPSCCHEVTYTFVHLSSLTVLSSCNIYM